MYEVMMMNLLKNNMKMYTLEVLKMALMKWKTFHKVKMNNKC